MCEYPDRQRQKSESPTTRQSESADLNAFVAPGNLPANHPRRKFESTNGRQSNLLITIRVLLGSGLTSEIAGVFNGFRFESTLFYKERLGLGYKGRLVCEVSQRRLIYADCAMIIASTLMF